MSDDKTADFCLPDENGEKTCLDNYRGKWIILYFYPKDNTSGCTKEAIDFTRYIEEFNKLDTTIIGVSPDSPESHKKFIEKHGLKIKLLSDKDHKILEKYDVWQLKKMYGREYYGVIRSTFLINSEGEIIYEWRKVKVSGHVEEVLEKLKEAKK